MRRKKKSDRASLQVNVRFTPEDYDNLTRFFKEWGRGSQKFFTFNPIGKPSRETPAGATTPVRKTEPVSPAALVTGTSKSQPGTTAPLAPATEEKQIEPSPVAAGTAPSAPSETR